MNAVKVAKTRRSTKLARKLGFYRHDNGVRSRIYSLTLCRDPWWQWGHRLMILTGTNEGGNWSEPEPDHLRRLVAIFDAAASPAESEATTDDGAPA